MKWISQVENLEALCLKGRWYVRPAGTLGTCGFFPVPWELMFIPRARNANDAITKALKGGCYERQ